MIYLYNTLTRQKEVFKPLHPKEVSFYSCGPTVYHDVHIGNLRSFLLADMLKRTLQYHGYTVNHVMNITDVGHLTDDGDQGEDKMEKGARREGKSVWDIAAYYTERFYTDLEKLNIKPARTYCKATDHIQEQINQVQQLIDNGHTYETSDGIYFDTTTIDDYGALAQLDKQTLQEGKRVDMGEKKNPHDFALWKFSPSDEQRQMEWDAFGRKGFPGWHIECSAMASKYLGDQFDIHSGGIDLSRVHHVNEIAQAECNLKKKPWVRYWVHNEFINIENQKMSKSDGTFIILTDIIDRNIDPLAYRYFLLQAHYRKQLNMSWDAIEAADHGLKKLRRLIHALPDHPARDPKVMEDFLDAMYDDLNSPEALAILWTAVKKQRVDKAMVTAMDKILGLKLLDYQEETVDIPDEIQTLLDQRKQARADKHWEESDKIRDEIASLGYSVEDTSEGQKISMIHD